MSMMETAVAKATKTMMMLTNRLTPSVTAGFVISIALEFRAKIFKCSPETKIGNSNYFEIAAFNAAANLRISFSVL